MRKILILGLVLSLAVLAHAGAAAGKPAGDTVKGYVAAVDQQAKSFSLKSCPNCEDIIAILFVNDATAYYPKGTGWRDVQPNAHVRCNFKVADEKKWAVTVSFLKGSDAPKKGDR